MTAHFEDAPVLIVSQACRYSSLDQTQEPFKLLDLLLAHGADINAQNYRGHTALSQAASRGDESMVEYLLEHGAERAVKNRLGASPRRVARAQGHTKVARMLEY
ncbi:hypothetical protein PTSG_12072 [Salpingoeca rosetta]|uniref:Uncharacterized protein n=1 Tax=Salpingoeca rosetta (strain ATCC 50818 / BSB-021) TaxID=946362 RepID=F2U6G8_SALR5|nr:uncharacterized protein PTSG_12072 [Salpingoeca rosetta]EGD83109.1 hypothetical protein PTSG_12072 [Salpingoeca rosetta]|eukprot:XP_004995473.1 hypothetical protein PTSG_12072 [Salpingoeca rosetta]